MVNIEMQALDPGEPRPHLDNINIIGERRRAALAEIDEASFSYIYRRLLLVG